MRNLDASCRTSVLVDCATRSRMVDWLSCSAAPSTPNAVRTVAPKVCQVTLSAPIQMAGCRATLNVCDHHVHSTVAGASGVAALGLTWTFWDVSVDSTVRNAVNQSFAMMP